jgi:hypothetical protein
MSEILDIDHWLENDELLARENEDKTFFKRKKAPIKTADDLENEPVKIKHEAGPTKSAEKIYQKASDALTRNAKDKLSIYLKQSPQFKTIEQQLDILLETYKNYKNAGNIELATKTELLIKELSLQKKKFIRFYKDENYSKVKDQSEAKIKKSELLKDLKLKRENLEKAIRMNNPNSLIKMVSEFRKTFEFLDKNALVNEIADFDDELDNFQNTENYISSNQEYIAICNHIADMADLIPEEVMKMNLNELHTILKTTAPDISHLKQELDTVKLKAVTEINRLKGNSDITDIIFSMFDFETSLEEQPKEMLAASNVKYVKIIAYNMCASSGALHQLEDAIAYGLLGLTLAINKWYEIQKINDSPVSFGSFSHLYISNTIRRGLYELMYGGRLSGSTAATLIHYRRKRISSFLDAHPELKELPEDMMLSMIDGIEPLPTIITTESEYTDIVGGQDGDSGDIWANAAVDESSDIAETRMEYEELVKGIKKLFKLFKSNDGTKSKLQLDKYDFKLFKMLFGLEFKKIPTDNGATMDSEYSQEEMSKILENYARANGENKTFSQPAISSRKDKMIKFINQILDENPELKQIFAYFYYNNQASLSLKYLSNQREEVTIKLEREELKEIYADNEDILMKKLSDGKTLNDIYEKTSVNPFDDEIANAFLEF